MLIFGFLTTRNKIHQIPHVIFGTKNLFFYFKLWLILYHLSFSCRKIPLKCSSWKIMRFGQKQPMKVHFFTLLECFNKSSLNFSCHFWNHKARVYSKFASPSSIVQNNYSAIFFSSNLIYFGQKEPIKVKFLDFWVVGSKFPKFLMSYLKPQKCRGKAKKLQRC